MLSKFKRLFNKGRWGASIEDRFDDDPELSWLHPPADPLNASAWDRYWTEHMEHGLGPPLFDMFCDDRELVTVMHNREMKSVLCAGNGISQEPRALAEAGLNVVALDLSNQAVEIARSFEFPPQAFEAYCDAGSRRPGGTVEFVVGDFLDPSVCPGPFDVIIERRTAQIFFNNGLEAVLNALADRLSQDGIFVSHCHDGAWKPPARPRHFTKSWFKKNGWYVCTGNLGKTPAGRIAWLFTTTG
jgi:SAM-dependent methyltransferase